MTTGDFYAYYTVTDTTGTASSNGSVSASHYGYPLMNTYTDARLSSPIIDELQSQVKELFSMFFRKVVVQCPWCGQWGASMCACKYCGGAIGLGDEYEKTT